MQPYHFNLQGTQVRHNAGKQVIDDLRRRKTLCRTRFYDAARFNLDSMAWGLLHGGGSEDCARCITPRPLRLISPRDAETNVLDNLAWHSNAATFA